MASTPHDLQIPRADEFIALLRGRIPEPTVAHSISVARLMMTTAGLLDIDPGTAGTAGLLHDLAKGKKGKVLLAEAERDGLEVTPLQREKPKLLHGPVAAEECRRELGIDDPHIYEAIYWHTTGRPELGKLGLLLYYADFAEPLRARPEALHARRLVETKGFLDALRYVSERKLQYIHTKSVVDPMTDAFNNWLAEVREL